MCTTGIEALVEALAHNIERAFGLAAMAASHAPKAREMFERMTNPVVGDLVVEVSSVRHDPQRIGVLLEIIETPSFTPEQWVEFLADEREAIERAKMPGARPDPMGVDAFLVQRGPRFPERTPIPTETEYVIEPFLGDDETVTWCNARFIAGYLSAHDNPHFVPVKLSRAMLRAVV